MVPYMEVIGVFGVIVVGLLLMIQAVTLGQAVAMIGSGLAALMLVYGTKCMLVPAFAAMLSALQTLLAWTAIAIVSLVLVAALGAAFKRKIFAKKIEDQKGEL